METRKRSLPPEAASWAEEFLRLNRRRRAGARPPLSASEYERWLDLRWRIEEALEGPERSLRGPPRKALRVPTNLKVEYADREREEISHVDEIGEGGLFIVTEHPAAAGTALRLKLTGNAGEVAEVEGTVVWTRRPGAARGRPGMGIQFACLDEGQREALACLVEAALAAL